MSFLQSAAKKRMYLASSPIEPLEERRLLTVQIMDGLLYVIGTPEADTLIVSLDPNDPNILVVDDNDTSYQFDIQQLTLDVTGIAVIGDASGDLIQIDESNGYIRFATHLQGDAGDDTILGGSGPDAILGGEGDDSLNGGGGIDRISGGLGDDTLDGGSEADYIYGGEGDDYITGSGGHDFIDGGLGDDNIDGSAGNDYILGGLGNDLILGDTGNDTLDGGSGDDQIYGEDGNDLILGREGNDDLLGGVGNDTIYGHRGNDLIYGQGSNDQIEPGLGVDSVYGGTGRDVFSVSKSERSEVQDFQSRIDSYGKITFRYGQTLNDFLIRNYYGEPAITVTGSLVAPGAKNSRGSTGVPTLPTAKPSLAAAPIAPSSAAAVPSLFNAANPIQSLIKDPDDLFAR